MLFPLAHASAFKMSFCFENHLYLFIELQEKELAAFISALPIHLDASCFDSGHLIASAPQIFLLFRDSLNDIASLSSQKTTIRVFPVFNKYLGNYAKYLQERLPKRSKKPLSAFELRLICNLINTADYCIVTCKQLNEKIKETVMNSGENVISSLDAAIQSFHIVGSLCQSSLDAHYKELFAGAWEMMATMIKNSWHTKHEVGDRSRFVVKIQTDLENLIALLKSVLIKPETFQTAISKLCRLLFEKFRRNIFAYRPISESGSQQLLVDIHALKACLLDQLQTAKQLCLEQYTDPLLD